MLERLASTPAKFYCKLTGFGASADAHHITASRPDGLGAILAMQSAMKNIDGFVDYINAHATSTPVGDEAEAMAVKVLFKGHSPCVSSSKGILDTYWVQQALSKPLFVHSHSSIRPSRPRQTS